MNDCFSTFFPPSCDTHLPHPVPGDLWEGDEAQTSVLQQGIQRGKAERALLRPIQQTSCCGELRAARVCVLAGWRLGSGESSRDTHTHTNMTDTLGRGDLMQRLTERMGFMCDLLSSLTQLCYSVCASVCMCSQKERECGVLEWQCIFQVCACVCNPI